MGNSVVAFVAMVFVIAAIPAVTTGLLARKFGWSARIQNLVCALAAVCCWLVAVYAIGIHPAQWFRSALGPNWANFIEFLTLILPIGFAPAIAQKLAAARP